MAPEIAVKVLFGTVELYNCAVIVTVEPIRANATVLLKYAAIEVMTPARGEENAKSITGPKAVPVRSIVPPTKLIPVAEDPNPMRLVVPINPPAIVVIITGPPDANGIIAPAPWIP